MIFEEPGIAPLVGIAFMLVCFAIQLLFCLKAKRQVIRLIPVCIILAAWGLILLLCTGLLGKGVGFLGNIHLMAAAILSIVVGFSSLGVAMAWIVYQIHTKRRAHAQ